MNLEIEAYAGELRELRAQACWCKTCDTKIHFGLRSRMSICPDCGDKRCPKAVQHDNRCCKHMSITMDDTEKVSRTGDPAIPETSLKFRTCKSVHPEIDTFYQEYREGNYYDRSCTITYGYIDGVRIDVYREYGGHQ